MFKNLSILVEDFHRILLFKDIHNYASIRESNNTKITSKYNVLSYLPEFIHTQFLTLVG